MQERLSAQIAALPTLNKAQLLAIWAENFSKDPPPNLRKELMVPSPGLPDTGERVRRFVSCRPASATGSCSFFKDR